MSLQILFKGPKLAGSLLTHAAGCAVCFVSPSLHFCICISQPQDRDGGGFLGAIAARILTFLVVRITRSHRSAHSVALTSILSFLILAWLVYETLKLFVVSDIGRRNTLHMISTMVAIFLAKVRRAISGLMPLVNKAV